MEDAKGNAIINTALQTDPTIDRRKTDRRQW
jgi:hypothetical protein